MLKAVVGAVVVATVYLAGLGQVRAQASQPGPFPDAGGAALVKTCSDTGQLRPSSKKNIWDTIVCYQYLSGAFGQVIAWHSMGEPPQGICLPTDASFQSLQEAVIAYLKAHPDQQSLQTSVAILEALSQTFPCRSLSTRSAVPVVPAPSAVLPDCSFAGVVPAPVPIQPYQLDRLKQMESAAAGRPGSIFWQQYVDYSNDLERQRTTPEEVEIVQSAGGYSVVGKSTGRLYRFVPTNCGAPEH